MKNIVKKYLELNQYNELLDEFEDLFQSHPNFPSLFAVTDTLTLLAIENIAIKLPKEQFEELPVQFLSIYKNQLVLISKKESKVIIENEELKKSSISITEFLENWEGITVLVEPNHNSNFYKTTTSSKWLLFIFLSIVLIGSSIYFNNYNFESTSTLITSITGLCISVFILQEKYGFQNEVISNFCSSNQNVSCNSVVQSKSSDLIKNFNFSDLPIVFFSISTLSLLIQPQSSTIIVNTLSFISIPLIGYSIWLQKKVVKKWCLLCLLVSVIILIQSLMFLNSFDGLKIYSKLNYSTFIITSTTLIALWHYFKPIFESNLELDKKNIALNKFKRNFQLFQFLSKDIEEYDDFEKLKGISFGNKEASTQLTLILSPSCGHCHKAFEDGYHLVQKFPNQIHLHILFNLNPENENNPYKKIVEHLIALNFQNQEKAKEALIDWHIKRYDMENWLMKWSVEAPIMLVSQQIQNQYYWCSKNNFNFTPVKLINDNIFPINYEIEELKYFINEFEIKSNNENSLEAV